MPAPLDLADQKFNCLIAIEFHESRGGNRIWRCLCECGNYAFVRASALRSGEVVSCGCAQRKAAQRIDHGQAKKGRHSREYDTWVAMRYRCSNENCPEWENYGGRGISVCARWDLFENFFEDMGARPAGMSLERIDVNGGYAPENCKWATPKDQARNLRKTIRISAFGETKPLTQWAEELGINERRLRNRIQRGWDPEAALSPLSGRKRTSALYTLGGLTMSASEWANHLQIPANTIFTRLARGWPMERVLSAT